MRRLIQLIGAATLAALLVFPNQSARADVLVTNLDTLRDALTNSVVTNFAPNVNIIMTSVGGTLDITHNTLIDPGTNILILDGGNVTRLFNVHPDCQLILNNVQLTNGYSSSNGGAIYNQGTLVISNCVFVCNMASNASGTNGVAGTNTTFNGSNAGAGGSVAGGAIYSQGLLYVYNSYFAYNTNLGGNGGYGGNGETTLGAVYSGYGGNGGAGGNAYGAAICGTGASNVFYATEFMSNYCLAGTGGTGGLAGTNLTDVYLGGGTGEGGQGGAAVGGALYISGALNLSNCLFAANLAAGGNSGPGGADITGAGTDGANGGAALGGGLYLTTTAKIPGYLENAVFFENGCFGGDGGGAAASSSVAGNGGEAAGGGMELAAGTAYIGSSTFATNSLTGGPAGTDVGTNSTNGIVGTVDGRNLYRLAGTLQIADSILAGPSGNAVGVTDGGYNISTDSSLTSAKTTSLHNTNPDLDSNLSIRNTVALGPVGGGGALLPTLAVLAGPATNALPGVPGLTFPAYDEEMQARRSTTTIGAYEFNPITPVTNAPPSITSEPVNQTKSLGQTGSLSVSDSPNPQDPNPIGYQWLLNGTNLAPSANYTGVNSSSLAVKDISGAELGAYQVVVSSSLLDGAVTSSVAYLLVDIPAGITTQPSSRNVPFGAVVTFKVGVSGAPPFFFHWMSNDVALTDVNEFSGSATSNLTINPVTFADRATYSVLVSNYFHAVTSASVHLTVVADHTRPTLSVTNPANNARITYTNDYIAGNAADNAQVTEVICFITNIFAGATNVVTNDAVLNETGTNSTTWSLSNAFMPGSNIVAVRSMDYSSNLSAIVNRKFFYVVPSPFTLYSNADGSVSGTASLKATEPPTNGALLNVGENYTLTAHPAQGFMLSNWSSPNFVVYSNSLHFTMTSNLSITATFAPSPFAATPEIYNGLFFAASNGVTPQTAGMISGLTVNSSGAYSGKLLLEGTAYSLSGNFNILGESTNRYTRPVARGGPFGVGLNIDFTNSAMTGFVSGEFGTNAWVSPVYAEEGIVTTNSGSATLLMTPSTNGVGATPPGSGYILLTNHEGNAIMTGALPDGTVLSESVRAGTLGDVPVYKTLYANGGLLIGWLYLTNGTPEVTNGFVWIKPAKPGLYAAGFSNVMSVLGSPWTNGAGFSLSGNLTVSNAVLEASNAISVSGGVISGTSVRGTVNAKTGLVRLTFDTDDGNVTGYGTVLENSTNLGGYFLNRNGDGAIYLGSSAQLQSPLTQSDSLSLRGNAGGPPSPPIPGDNTNSTDSGGPPAPSAP